MKTEPIFGSKELSEKLLSYLQLENDLVRKVLTLDIGSKLSQIKILLATCSNTAQAIVQLSHNSEYFFSEMIVLSRAFVEKSINFCYLAICDESEYDNYLKYTIQKSYRKLDRSEKCLNTSLGIKYSGASSYLESNPEIQEAVTQFTSKNGKEITRWTKANIQKRIEIIAEKSDLNHEILMLNILSIYEDASETLHGTLYGCSYHTWCYEPNIDHTNPAEVEINTQKKISLLFIQLCALFHECVGAIGTEVDIADFITASKELTLEASSTLKMGMGNK
jgi:hypothetical protein